MADLKIPNLCGASPEFNAIQTEFEKLIKTALDGLEDDASTLAANALSDLNSLETELRALIPEMPALPDLNLQSLLTGLSSLTPGSSAHTQALADITSDFGTALSSAGFSLDTLVTDALSAIQGGSGLCSAVSIPNFTKAADGLSDAIEKAPESLQPIIDSSSEKLSTLVPNTFIAGVKEDLSKIVASVQSGVDIPAGQEDAYKFDISGNPNLVSGTTPPTEDTGVLIVATLFSDLVTTAGNKVKVTTPNDASTKTVETNISGDRIGSRTKWVKKTVADKGFSSRPIQTREFFSKFTDDGVTLRFTPVDIKAVYGYYTDNDVGKIKELKPLSQAQRGYDTYTVSGKVLTITQDKAGPYEGRINEAQVPEGTKLKVAYSYNDTYDPRFISR